MRLFFTLYSLRFTIAFFSTQTFLRDLPTAYFPLHHIIVDSLHYYKFPPPSIMKWARDESDVPFPQTCSSRAFRGGCGDRAISMNRERPRRVLIATSVALFYNSELQSAPSISSRNTTSKPFPNQSLKPLHVPWPGPSHSLSLWFCFYQKSKKKI